MTFAAQEDDGSRATEEEPPKKLIFVTVEIDAGTEFEAIEATELARPWSGDGSGLLAIAGVSWATEWEPLKEKVAAPGRGELARTRSKATQGAVDFFRFRSGRKDDNLVISTL